MSDQLVHYITIGGEERPIGVEWGNITGNASNQPEIVAISAATVGAGQKVNTLSGEVQDLKERVGDVESDVTGIKSNVQTLSGSVRSLNTRVGSVENEVTTIKSNVLSLSGSVDDLKERVDDLDTAVAGKLDKLSGNNVIYGNDASGAQTVLTAGTGIKIEGGFISSTITGGTGSANWGSIGGTITNQGDLMGAFGAASAYTDSKVATEESARIAADDALDARIDALEAASGSSHVHANKAILDTISQDKINAWDSAEANAIASAKTYTDTLVGEEATARIAADDELSARIDAISGQSHAHANKDVLDAISQEKVDAWDAAEANAKAYADEQVQALSAATVTALEGKQETLVSGTNIKTINGQSILGSGNIEIQGGGSGKTYYAGTGITINAEDKINANTEATTVGEIVIAGGPISAAGIWEDNKIPEGTSVQEILTKLLCKELYPDAATKPSASLNGNSIASYVLVGSKVNLPRIYMVESHGKFNASKYSTPTQPLVQGVQWSNKSVTATINNGFPGLVITSGETEIPAMSDVATQLGLNKVTYNGSDTYSEPTNMPVTNLNHPTRSTSSVTTASTEYSAVWTSGTSRPSKSIQTIGVYPLYTNINEASKTIVEECNIELMKNAATELVISGASEVVAGRHFMVDIPTGRTFSGLYAWNDMAKSWDKQDASAYEVVNDGTIKHTVNGVEYGYMRIKKVGAMVGATIWKFVWNNSLDK